MIERLPVVALTLRSLVDRRRFWLMVGLAAIPVLLAAAALAFDAERMTTRIFGELIVRAVLPLVALAFGTAALGSELDDGTIVFLLTKPMRRGRIVLAKAVVAAGLTALLMVPSTLLSVTLAPSSVGDDALLAEVVAVAVGGTAYAVGFLALSVFSSRALAIGLGYVLLWEGVLAGLFEGTQLFSVRQATLGLARMLEGDRAVAPQGLDGPTSVVVLASVIAGGLLLGTWRLARYQLRGSD